MKTDDRYPRARGAGTLACRVETRLDACRVFARARPRHQCRGGRHECLRHSAGCGSAALWGSQPRPCRGANLLRDALPYQEGSLDSQAYSAAGFKMRPIARTISSHRVVSSINCFRPEGVRR